MRQDVTERGLAELVKRDRLQRKRQLEKLLAQVGGNRLPYRSRGELGQVVRHAVDQLVRGTSKRVQLGFACGDGIGLAHGASIGADGGLPPA
jgi:hypothetical protein